MVSPGKMKLNQDKRFKDAFQECEVFFSEAQEVVLDQWGWGWGWDGVKGSENGCVGYGAQRPSSSVYPLQVYQQSVRPQFPYLLSPD